jgi:hypothetical protein
MAEEKKVPEGFKALPYPNLETERDDTVYICEKCVPAWDTFDLEAAKAHAIAGRHNPQATLWREGV